MKTLLSLCLVLVASLSFSVAQATAPSPDIVAELPYAWNIDCADFDCPISGSTILRQSYWAHDCRSVPEERIKSAANEMAKRFCRAFAECCEANGCDESRCRLVDYKWECVSNNRLVIYVKVEYKCG